jgi:hypothetical protein
MNAAVWQLLCSLADRFWIAANALKSHRVKPGMTAIRHFLYVYNGFDLHSKYFLDNFSWAKLEPTPPL